MKASLDTYINMLRTIAKLYTDYKARFDAIPAVKDAFAIFKGYLLEIDKWQAEALVDPTIYAEVVTGEKTALSVAAETVGLVTGAYAAFIGNEVLRQIMDVRASILVKEKKDRLPNICQTIYDEANAVKVPALPFNLTEEMLETLNDAITAYKDQANTPRLEHGNVRTANVEVEKYIDFSLKLLKEQLDRMVASFRLSDPPLVTLWKVARRLVRPPRKYTQLLLTVLSPEMEPVEDAKVIVSKKKDITVFTDEMGKALVKPAPPGLVTLKITAEGFKPYLKDKVKLKLGEETVLEVMLERIVEEV